MNRVSNKLLILALIALAMSETVKPADELAEQYDRSQGPITKPQENPLELQRHYDQSKLTQEPQIQRKWYHAPGDFAAEKWNKFTNLFSKADAQTKVYTHNTEEVNSTDDNSGDQPNPFVKHNIRFNLPDPEQEISDILEASGSPAELVKTLQNTNVHDIATLTPETSEQLLNAFLQHPESLNALQTEPEKFEALYKKFTSRQLKGMLFKALPADSRLQKIPANIVSIMAPDLSSAQLFRLSSDQLESIHEKYPGSRDFETILKLKSKGLKNAWRSKDVKQAFKNNTDILADYLTVKSGKTVQEKVKFIQSAIQDLSVADQETLFKKIAEADLSKQLDLNTLSNYFDKLDPEKLQTIENEVMVQKQFKAGRTQAQTEVKQRQEQESVRKHIEENLENYLKTSRDNLGKPAAERTKGINEEYAKKALAKLTPAQRAQLLTNIARDEISRTHNGYAQTAEIFENVRDTLSPLLPPTDVILINHDGKESFNPTPMKSIQGSLGSYHFKILDMANFTYDPMVDMKVNAMRLNDQENLHIANPDVVARAMRKYFEKDPIKMAKYLASDDLMTKDFSKATHTQIEQMKHNIQAANFSTRELNTLLNKIFKRRQDLSPESMQNFLAEYQRIMPNNIILVSHSGTIDENGNPIPGSTITVYNLYDDHILKSFGNPNPMIRFFSSMSPASIAELPHKIFTDANVLHTLFARGNILNSHFNTAQRAAIIAKSPEKIQNRWLTSLQESTNPKIRLEATKIQAVLDKKAPGVLKK
jgi:hypothetical protein